MFIKFIIPCYNVGNTIGRMLDSILSQTFTDYHIVCVEDCSTDNTWDVLQKYEELNSKKITLIKNPCNMGAGSSRNIGVNQTKDIFPSEFLWVVDGDDYLADSSVLQRIYGFSQENPQYDLIEIGWTRIKKKFVARLGCPIGMWGRVIRQTSYVYGIEKNIRAANDVYPHFVLYDNVDDSKIGKLDYNCYIYPQFGKHINNTDMKMNIGREIGLALMEHVFRKPKVVEVLMSDKGKWIKRCFKGFDLKCEWINGQKGS